MGVVTKRGWPVVLVFGPRRLRAGELRRHCASPALLERLARVDYRKSVPVRARRWNPGPADATPKGHR